MKTAKPPIAIWAAPTPTDCAAPVKRGPVEEVVEPVLGARVVVGRGVVVGADEEEEEADEDEMVLELLVVLDVELEADVVVTTAEVVVVVVEVATAEVVEVVVDSTTGRMMLRDTVAPHSAREDPLGQHPPSVQ